MAPITRRLAAAAGALLLIVTLAACSGASSTPPNLVGTWTGEYAYPVQDGTSLTSTETITITKQDGAMLWATTSWTAVGDTGEGEAVGTVIDGTRITLAEHEGGAFQGTVEGDTMTLVFTRTDAENTAFEVVLTRQP